MSESPTVMEESEMSRAVRSTLLAGREQFLAFLRRRLGSNAVAEDILQEAFVRALTRAESLRDGESAVAWFYRVLRNAVTDHHRRRAAEDRALARAAEEPQQSSVDEELMATVCGCVRTLLDALPEDHATALRQVELEERSVTDYAQSVGITPNNASVRLHRARKALLARVVESCGTCCAEGCADCDCNHARSNSAPSQA